MCAAARRVQHPGRRAATGVVRGRWRRAVRPATYAELSHTVAWGQHDAPHTDPRGSTTMRKILFMIGTAVFGRIMKKRREGKSGH